jgi:hypothetical protein
MVAMGSPGGVSGAAAVTGWGREGVGADPLKSVVAVGMVARAALAVRDPWGDDHEEARRDRDRQ